MQEILSVFGVNWKLLIVQIINFSILLLLLYRFLYKPILRIIEERRQKIIEGLEDAERSERGWKDFQNEKDLLMRTSLKEGDAIVKDAREKAEYRKKEIITDANEHGSRIVLQAQKTAQNEKEKLLKESREEIARLAVLGAEKILRKE